MRGGLEVSFLPSPTITKLSSKPESGSRLKDDDAISPTLLRTRLKKQKVTNKLKKLN